MRHETDGWKIGDKVYYFDTRNTTEHSVSQIMFCCGKVDFITAHNIYTDNGALLLPGQYYRTLDELKNAVLKQIDEEVLWLKKRLDKPFSFNTFGKLVGK